MFLQFLIGDAASKEVNKNYIRGRRENSSYNEQDGARIKQGLTTTRTTDRLSYANDRHLERTSEFNDFFGISSKEMVDPVAVYMLFLFDLTTSEHISWTIREISTRDLVASAEDGKYASHTDVTEIIELVPDTTYELEVVDDSLASIRDRVRGTYTNFAIVTTEPAQEIATGTIASGATESFVFTVPGTSTNVDQIEADPFELETGNSTSAEDSVDVGDDFIDFSEEPSLSPSVNPSTVPVQLSDSIPSTGPSSSPSVIPSASPSKSVSNSPSTVPSSKPSLSPSMIPSDKPESSVSTSPSTSPSVEASLSPSSSPSLIPSLIPTISQEPSSSPSQVPANSCGAKGDACESSLDCCGSGRCSPQKQCFTNDTRGRQRISPNQHGGAAGDLSRRQRRERQRRERYNTLSLSF